MNESHIRSLVKAISWRIIGSLMTIMISYLIVDKMSYAIYIGIFEFIAKVIGFYLHERLWAKISLGIHPLNATQLSKISS